jgi:hypothetical protein
MAREIPGYRELGAVDWGRRDLAGKSVAVSFDTTGILFVCAELR